MKIRRATTDDVRQISEVHRASIREICSSAYSPEQIAAWTEPLAPERYLPAIRDFEFFVAEEQEIVGFSILNLEGAELNAIYLHPAATARGIGRSLFEHAENIAREASLSELKLKSTTNAVGFYRACGFSRVRDSVHRNPFPLGSNSPA